MPTALSLLKTVKIFRPKAQEMVKMTPCHETYPEKRQGAHRVPSSVSKLTFKNTLCGQEKPYSTYV